MLAIFAVTLLFSGGMIYLAYRPTDLYMFEWARFFGYSNLIDHLRHQSILAQLNPPSWMVYSVPFALWVVAYQCMIGQVWADCDDWVGQLWFWLAPLVAISSEFLQLLGFMQGTFDWIDVFWLTAASSVGLFLKQTAGAR
nr:hypothetical protein [uncultured Aquabacterium sp.]